MNNITIANFDGTSPFATSQTLVWEYDQTQYLQIEGLELPYSCSVDFCNVGDASTITMPCVQGKAEIPNDFFETGKNIKAYVVLTDDASVQTRYEIVIPVIKRPTRTDIQPTPAEQQQIDALIVALNDGVDAANEAADEAAESADEASASAAAALASEQAAQASASEADQAASSAAESVAEVRGYATDAEQAATAAAMSESNAGASAQASAASAQSASDSATSAADSASAAADAVSDAAGYANEASQYATAANQYAANASGHASDASDSAADAAQKADDASTSATAAAQSAGNASSKASEASQSAANASASATAAATSATAAANAQTAAETAQGKAEDAQEAAETAAASVSESAAQIAQNTEDISDLKSDLGVFSYDVIDGKYVYAASGQEGSVASYVCTNYIVCDSVGISVKTEVASADTAGICFYDNNKNYVSGFNPSSHNYNYFDLDIPENATYVRVSCLARYKNSLGIKRYDSIENIELGIGTIKENVATLQGDMTVAKSVIEISSNLLTVSGKTETWVGVSMSYADGVLEMSGTATGSGGRTKRLTSPIALEAGTYIFWAENTSGISNATLYIENASTDAIIADIANGNAWSRTFTLSANTSVYLGANVVNGTTYNSSCLVMLEKGSSKSEYESPSYASSVDVVARKGLLSLDTFWSYAMGKVLCIGDSLTSGACFTGNWDGASIDQNYPRLLDRMLDADVTNAGVSGLTASQWYANEISKYTLANYDTFIIWLGTNGGLTDTLDTDVNPYSDYNDFANTNTGNYCKIIEKIKADNSDCLIILTKVFVSDATNTVIDKIATKYSLPIVDNSDLTVANYPALHGNINNVHFTKAGNLFIADRYVKKMAEVFAENPAMTNYGLTARTN